jgi:putative thioredoxin
VAEFNGLRLEPAVREFLKTLEPASSDLTVGRANGLLATEAWAEAETLFREVLAANPDQPGALLGLARALLAQGLAALALPILREFPASKEYPSAEQLVPLARALADLELGELDLAGDHEEQTAVFINALRLASRSQILPALDGLLDVLRDRKFPRRQEARMIFLGLLQVLGEGNAHTRQYRSELATLLF